MALRRLPVRLIKYYRNLSPACLVWIGHFAEIEVQMKSYNACEYEYRLLQVTVIPAIASSAIASSATASSAIAGLHANSGQ